MSNTAALELFHIIFLITYGFTVLALEALGLTEAHYLLSAAIIITFFSIPIVMLFDRGDVINFISILFTYVFNRKAYLEKGLGGLIYDVNPFIQLRIRGKSIFVSTKDKNLMRTGVIVSEIKPPFFKSYDALRSYIEKQLTPEFDLKVLTDLYLSPFYKPLAPSSVSKLSTINFKVSYTYEEFKKELPPVLQDQLTRLKSSLLKDSLIVRRVSKLFSDQDKFIFIFNVETLKNGSTSVRIMTNNPFMKFVAISSSICKYTSCFIGARDIVESYALNPAMFVTLRVSNKFESKKFFITTRAWLRVNTAECSNNFVLKNAVLFPIYGDRRKSLIKFVKRVLSRVMLKDYKNKRTKLAEDMSIKYLNNRVTNDLVSYGKPGLFFYVGSENISFVDYSIGVNDNNSIYLKLF